MILFFLSPIIGGAQPSEITIDLKDHWKVLKGQHLEKYEGVAAQAIHLLIEDSFKGGILSIKAPDEFTLFVNGQLQRRTRHTIKVNVDSLLQVKGGAPLLSVYQKGDVRSIKTELIVRKSLEHENILRASSHFNDFVTLSSLLLFGLFVILFRSNTRLTVDYLNFIKIFSIQEREDPIVTGRIGSSVNLLFFVFISLLLGLLLLIVFHSGPPALKIIYIESVSGAFGWWLHISLYVLIFLITKLGLVWALSQLYNYKGLVRFQFFNFVRSLYVASALMGLLLLLYFVLKLANPEFYYFLLVAVCGFMIISAFFFYLKLLRRISSSVFHLFSYLCSSEIIVLMILVKMLLN